MFNLTPGAQHGFEKNLIHPCWSPCGDFIACGSADRTVLIWKLSTGKICYKLPGHKGCVNGVAWIGNVVASAGSDKNVYLGELDVLEVM